MINSAYVCHIKRDILVKKRTNVRKNVAVGYRQTKKTWHNVRVEGQNDCGVGEVK